MKQPDILLFMSDQHGADYCSWGDVKVDTPTLDAIRKTGTVFENTYTSCPLCVPARISLCHLSCHQIQGAMVIRMRYRILHLALHMHWLRPDMRRF